ncbi:MAG: transcription antitermination factor NusB [Candidatus Korobacteraceae bacterium]
MVSPSRAAAFDVLLRVEREQAHAGELLHSDILKDLSPADRGLTMQLVMGALRWQGRVDAALSTLVSQPLAKLDVEVLTALRLAAYQIGFLDRVPARAAVNESVELVKRARKRSAMGFANAVLRKLATCPELLQPVLAPGSKTVLDLAQLYAHPTWLVDRWAEAYGMEVAERICAWNQEAPSMAVRLRDPGAEGELRQEGVELAPGNFLASARRVVSGDLVRTRAFAERRVVVQDEASQLVAMLVGHGERLLDCCAAPGGKSAVLAERNPKATVVATDVHPHRARLMQRLLASSSTSVHVIAARAESLPLRGGFDRVLADVPCSGTGTLARNPEIKWKLRLPDLVDLHRRQVAILRAAMQQVKPGGRLLYSTCSLEPEENAGVVNEVLEQGSDFRLCYAKLELERLRHEGELLWHDVDSILNGPFLRTLPGVHPCDGFFAAILERKGNAAD